MTSNIRKLSLSAKDRKDNNLEFNFLKGYSEIFVTLKEKLSSYTKDYLIKYNNLKNPDILDVPTYKAYFQKEVHRISLEFLNNIIVLFFISNHFNYGLPSYKAFNNIMIKLLSRLSQFPQVPQVPQSNLIIKDFKDLAALINDENALLLNFIKENESSDILKQIFEYFSRFKFILGNKIDLKASLDKDLITPAIITPAIIGQIYYNFALGTPYNSDYDKNRYGHQEKHKKYGVYYTSSSEIEFICRKSIAVFLADNLPSVPKEVIYDLIYSAYGTGPVNAGVSPQILSDNYRRELEGMLYDIRIFDPACGSGDFLIGALRVLTELINKLYIHKDTNALGKNSKSAPQDNEVINLYEVKKHIIENCLYGMDIFPWAIKISEERLYLELLAEGYPSKKKTLKGFMNKLGQNDQKGRFIVEMIRCIIDPENINESAEAPIKFNLSVGDSICISEQDGKGNGKGNGKGKGKGKGNRKGREKQDGEGDNNTQDFLFHKFQNMARIKFYEVFKSKGGFDLIIGNPPYIRQELISPPGKEFSEVDFDDRIKYVDDLTESVKKIFPTITKLNRKSDYYVYFFFQGLNLLNKNGTLCFITSSAWLDVAYGRDLQEFFCKYTPIKAIYNTLIRSFKDADINTVITLLGAPIFFDKSYSGPILLRKMGRLQSKVWGNIAKFIDLKKPIDEFLDPKIMLELENVNVVHEGIKYSSLIRNIVENEYYRAFPILQADLLMMGGVDIKNIIHRYYGESDKCDKKDALISVLMDRLKWGNYRLCKWGGLFFRAPDIFFRILSKGGDKLVPLGEIAKIKFGIKTGANDFFYFPNKYFDIILENQKGIKNEDLNYYYNYNYYKLIPKKEGLPSDLRIEAKYLKPLIKSSRDCDHILIDNSFSKYKILICHKNKSALRELNEYALKYIEWGEGFSLTIRRGFDKGQKLNGFHNIKSVQTRKNWFEIKERPISLNILPMFENERKFCFYNPHRLYIDASLYYVYPKKDIDQYKLNIVLNSTLFALFKEIMARPPEGMGALQIKIYHYQQMPVLNILNEELDIEVPQSYQNFLNREIKSIFDELGFDPDLPIRDQDPKPLPDRAEIDTIIFNKLGLSEDERKDVYWTLAELVKKRLTKAKSLDV